MLLIETSVLRRLLWLWLWLLLWWLMLGLWWVKVVFPGGEEVWNAPDGGGDEGGGDEGDGIPDVCEVKLSGNGKSFVAVWLVSVDDLKELWEAMETGDGEKKEDDKGEVG